MRQKEIDQEPVLKSRVRIYVLTNRSNRIAAIRRALSNQEGKDLFTEDVNDILMEEGCKKLEKQLGLETAA